MFKQYLVCVQQKHQQKSGEYYNLYKIMRGLRGSYYLSLDEAMSDLQKYIAEKNKGERTETTVVNGIGIDLVIDAETAKSQAVVDWYISEREVTKWSRLTQMNK